jgi:hypothetical protein
MSNNNDHEVPPHMNTPDAPADAPAQPAIDPNLQQAMAALFQAMTANVQADPPRRVRERERDRDEAPRHRVKTREPDAYDGTDPSKLRAFLSQCKLVFRSSPHAFADDQLKIMYAVSYLKGTAQRWFEPNLALDELDLPDHALTWHRFEEELTATFGEPDPVASATAKLDNLSMKDSHHIAKYNVEFNEYAVLTGFDNRALYAKYYKGLAPRIKDGLVYVGRPHNLEGLRNKAQALDLRYWERKDEDRSYTSTSGPSSSRPSSGNTAATPSYSSKSHTTQSRFSSRATTPAASSSSAPASKKTDLTKILGPDGKLLPEERERRRKNNLCMICGSDKHFVDKCPSNKDKAQGRSAHLDDVQEESLSEDSAPEADASEPLN